MNLHESLSKSAGNPRFRVLGGSLRLEKDGLTLGSVRLLARNENFLDLGGNEERLFTLLAVAYGQPVDASVLGTIRCASKHARAVNEAMASMHVALIKLPQLGDPTDAARRISIADDLLAKGVRPRDIFAALEFDPSPLDQLEKEYNPNQLRVPAGSGRTSGEWARDIEAVEDAVESAAESASRVLPIALRIGSRVAGPAAALAGVLIPTPAGGADHQGTVQGHPELRTFWNGDTSGLWIIRISDGRTVFRASRGENGELKVGPKIIG